MEEKHEPEITECAYCGKNFDSELERGIHQADKHVDPDERFETKKKRQHNPYTNLIDEWKKDKALMKGEGVSP